MVLFSFENAELPVGMSARQADMLYDHATPGLRVQPMGPAQLMIDLDSLS
jgi:hypothetical protein